MIKHIALIGNPNSGKSTIFNLLTGVKQKTGNYPGVTVEKKEGKFKLSNGSKIKVTDLPGAYSLNATSEDEQVVSNFIYNKERSDFPDLFIMVVDSSNLERNLLLFTQIYDLKLPVILILNMIDLAEKANKIVDASKLSSLLGDIPVLSFNAKNDPSDAIEDAIINYSQTNVWQPFFDKTDQEHPKNSSISETEIRYQKIKKLLKFSEKENNKIKRGDLSDKLDRILTHKVWGYLVFFGLLAFVFQSVYSYASVPMDLIESLFTKLGVAIKNYLPRGAFNDLLAEGLIPGLGGVLVFIPQIATLFIFLALLEESGYMTRVVFLMDRLMRPFGLHGKSVVPLMSGMACAIPAIMSARTISQTKERLITILVTPLMSCSARLPVYILIIALTIPDQTIGGFINLQGLVLLGMYLLGLIAALFFGFVFKVILKSKTKSYLIMEMPRYQVPKLKNVFLEVLDKVKAFVFDAGKIIISISIILWVLGSYGPQTRIINNVEGFEITQVPLEESFIGKIGKGIEPVIQPLGYDWKIGIALITSFAAREVFVGTMATIYSIGTEDELKLVERMRQEINPSGKPRYGLATGLSLMIFYAFAMQCMSTVAVTKRETNGWKWPLIQFSYMTGLAYISAALAYFLIN